LSIHKFRPALHVHPGEVVVVIVFSPSCHVGLLLLLSSSSPANASTLANEIPDRLLLREFNFRFTFQAATAATINTAITPRKYFFILFEFTIELINKICFLRYFFRVYQSTLPLTMIFIIGYHLCQQETVGKAHSDKLVFPEWLYFDGLFHAT
jgi:hypothetical protein